MNYRQWDASGVYDIGESVNTTFGLYEVLRDGSLSLDRFQKFRSVKIKNSKVVPFSFSGHAPFHIDSVFSFDDCDSVDETNVINETWFGRESNGVPSYVSKDYGAAADSEFTGNASVKNVVTDAIRFPGARKMWMDIPYCNLDDYMRNTYRDYETKVNLDPLPDDMYDKMPYATSMKRLCDGCAAVKNLAFMNSELSDLVHEMEHLFRGCASLETLDFPFINIEHIYSFHGMFDGCSSLKAIFFPEIDYRHVKELLCKGMLEAKKNKKNLFDGCDTLEKSVIYAFQDMLKGVPETTAEQISITNVPRDEEFFHGKFQSIVGSVPTIYYA